MVITFLALIFFVGLFTIGVIAYGLLMDLYTWVHTVYTRVIDWYEYWHTPTCSIVIGPMEGETLEDAVVRLLS